MSMIGVAEYAVYKRLTECYISKILAVVPGGMRAPTVNEIRRFDRQLHQEVLRWLSRGMGNLTDAIRYYLTHPEMALWKLLDPVVSSLPDQGVERADKKITEETRAPGKKRAADEPAETGPAERPKKTCLVCKKKHLPLCPLPEGFRKGQRDKKKVERAAKSRPKP